VSSTRILVGRVLSCALLALLAIASGCGYRSTASAVLPGDVRSVRVTPPDPSHTLEPRLPAMLAAELARHLARAGVRVATGHTEAVLSGKLLSLTTLDAPLDPSGRRVGARQLRLALELRLAAADGRTLWRSGLLEVDDLSPTAGGATASETARASALQAIAARAAARAVELLTSGL
jgi:hypothetical protein